MEKQKEKKYDELFDEYVRLEEEHNNLKNECSENVLLTSLNDMKVIYESCEKELNKLKNVISESRETTRVINIMIDTIIENLKHENKFKIESQLNFIKDVLEKRRIRYY
jgi:hypothetical protein